MYLGYRPQDMCGLSYPEQWHKLAPAIMRAYRKQAELLHYQLVRKGRAAKEFKRLNNLAAIGAINKAQYSHPTYGPVYIVPNYNIKSPATEPYNKDDKEKLGLNQLFMGQSPYEHYKGDISDGIYHDECYIISGRNLQDKELQFSNIIDKNGLLVDLKKSDLSELENLSLPARLTSVRPAKMQNNKITPMKIHNIGIEKIEKYETSIQGQDMEADNQYVLYLDNGNIALLIYRKQKDRGGDGGERVRAGKRFVEYKEYPAFYNSNDDKKDKPTMTLRKFIDNWDEYHHLFVDEDEEDWKTFIAPVLIIAGAIAAVFTGQAYILGEITSILTAIGGIAGGVGLALSGLAIGTGSKVIATIAKIVGAIGALAGLAGAIKNLGSALINSQSATTNALSAGNLATKAGLNATANTYLNTSSTSFIEMSISSNEFIQSSIRASAVQTAMSASVDFSTIMGSSNFSFAAASALQNTSPSILNLSIDALQKGYKAYGAVNEVFKKPNDYSDDAMPQSHEDSDAKRAVAMRANGELDNKLRKYREDEEVDLGLMEGSLLYMPSLLERIGDKPVSLK